MQQDPKNVSLIVIWFLFASAMLGTLSYKLLNNSINFDANIMNVLDLGAEIDDLTKAAAAPYSSKALLLLQAPEPHTSQLSLKNISQQLLALDLIEQATNDPSRQLDIQALIHTYTNYPLAFLSDKASSARIANNYSYIINNYMQLLSGPSNPLVSLTINQAPLLNLADWFNDKLSQNAWQQDGPFIYAEYAGLRYYPLFLEFNPDATKMDKVVASISAVNQVLTENRAADLSIYTSGYIFHSAAITEQASYEMQLFGGLSLLGVLLLTFISFRNIQPLLCISLLIASAMLAGMVALTLIFDTIHLLSLVFAVSLIGIAVDYGYHILLTAKHTGFRNHKLTQYIATAILVSGGTTLVSYLLLLFLPIPLLQQVAVFVAAGLAFTILTGLGIITHWPWQGKSESAENLASAQSHAPIQGFKLVTGLLIICSLATLPNWFFQDDINVFNSSPKHLLESEKMVSKIIGNQQYPRFIYTYADNSEQLLQRFEQIRSVINKATDEPFALHGIDQWLPSINTQQANTQWLQAGINNQDLSPIISYMTDETLDKLSATINQFMTLEQVPAEIAGLFPDITTRNGQLIGILSYMGPIDAVFLADIQAQLDFPLQYFDQPAKFTSALTKLRTYVLYFLAVAVVALLLLMTFRYGLLNGLKLVTLPIITAVSSLAISHIFLGYVTIFNLLGCILIIALSVDYAVFLREHGRLTHVLKAISLSAATSGLAFGMFVFSSTPAILQFGLTILIGVSIAWLLCLMLPLSVLQQKKDKA
ncbi:MMPL family transporter [Paraglaciecola sp. L3A3]|uniref:MMPL family transporter n=1 Tax=Paraglaciecola sp. L3A3 TaxID=2686358 RepID=UPI00131BC5D6|nr:MMPL family transporter [Paraglaciecola sp. L3A3]